MASRKFYVLTTPDNHLISDFNQTTTDINKAVSWLSEEAAHEAIRRCRPLLRPDLKLTQIEVPITFSI